MQNVFFTGRDGNTQTLSLLRASDLRLAWPGQLVSTPIWRSRSARGPEAAHRRRVAAVRAKAGHALLRRSAKVHRLDPLDSARPLLGMHGDDKSLAEGATMSPTPSFFPYRMMWRALLLAGLIFAWPQVTAARPPQLTMPPAKKLQGPLASAKPAFRRAHATPVAVPRAVATPTSSPTPRASSSAHVPSSSASRWPMILPLTVDRVKPVLLVHGKSGEHYRMMLVSAEGRLREQTLTEMRDFLACSKTSHDHPIHPRLLSLLHAVAAAYPGKSLIVHSGYRHPQVSHHAKRSNHTRGRAIDFRVQDVENRELFERVRHSFTGVGVGYYPNSAFVHLDVRDDEALWVDYAAPGESACYSQTPAQDLANGIAEQLSAEQARARGCDGPGKPDKSASSPVQKAVNDRQAQSAVVHDKSAR